MREKGGDGADGVGDGAGVDEFKEDAREDQGEGRGI